MTQEEKLIFDKYGTAYPCCGNCENIRQAAFKLMFPELVESEDERIRESIIKIINRYAYNSNTLKPKMLAWLEKQGEQKPIPKFKVGDTMRTLQEATDGYTDGMPVVVSIDEEYYHCNNELIAIKDQDDYEFPPINVKQKPADKVEPKFKVGDWVIDNNIKNPFLITDTSNGKYDVVSIYGNDFVFSFNEVERFYHLWTIQDAKDGDVVVCGDFGYTSIMLFESFSNGRISLHCWYNSQTDGFHVGAGVALGKNASVYPATKEQRDTLMKAMADDGYEWDADKKELKRIEQKPVEWSEEDDKMINSIAVHLNAATGGFPEDRAWADKFMIWLKSLKDRVQPQNLTVTDEELAQAKKDAYNDALDKIEYHSGKPTFDDGWSAAIWYLKKRNAQPQSHWKPSDEQMKALKSMIDITNRATSFDACKSRIVESIYEQLKAL